MLWGLRAANGARDSKEWLSAAAMLGGHREISESCAVFTCVCVCSARDVT